MSKVSVICVLMYTSQNFITNTLNILAKKFGETTVFNVLIFDNSYKDE